MLTVTEALRRILPPVPPMAKDAKGLLSVEEALRRMLGTVYTFDADFDESDHKRNKIGRFAKQSGGSSGEKGKEGKKEGEKISGKQSATAGSSSPSNPATPTTKMGMVTPSSIGGKGSVSGKVELKNKTLTDAEKVEARKFLLSKPIASVTSDVIKADGEKRIIDAAKEWAAKNIKSPVERQDVGEIVLDEKGVQDSLSHGLGRNKVAAVQALPVVIKQGVLLSITDDFDGKPLKNTLIAAPVQIDGEKDIVIARLRTKKGDVSRFYLHEVHSYLDKKKESSTSKTGRQDSRSTALKGGSAISAGKPVMNRSEAFMHNIPLGISAVNIQLPWR